MLNDHEKIIPWRELTEGEPLAHFAYRFGWDVHASRQPSWAGNDSTDETMVAIITHLDIDRPENSYTVRLYVEWVDLASKVNKHEIVNVETYDANRMRTSRRKLLGVGDARSVIVQHGIIDLDEVA